MRIAVFSSKSYDREALERANKDHGHNLVFYEPRLGEETLALAQGFEAIAPFVNDDLSAPVIEILAAGGTRLLTLRSAGYNHVDLRAAERHDVRVARVPAYSPYAVAEHAMGLILTLNRQFHRAHARIREGNFSLEGLLGYDLKGRTIGVIGTGVIGRVFCGIAIGFGCRVVAHDLRPDREVEDIGVEYVSLDELFQSADIVALHLPLTPDTYHLIDAEALERMKRGVMLINTSRGALVDTRAAIAGLKSGQLGAFGLDVYEEEADLFFEDLSNTVIQDDVFARLLTFPNVVITGHQGFFTQEALTRIAETTLANATAFERGDGEFHEVTVDRVQSDRSAE